MIKKNAFSLAEVLITLGIIGIVAAMTIPVIFSNTNSAKYRAKFKKSVSTLNQAGLMAQAHFEYNFAGTETICPTNIDTASRQNAETDMSMCAIFNSTLAGQTYIGPVTNLKRHNSKDQIVSYELVSRDTIPNDYTSYLAYTLADGTIFAFNPEAKGCELPLGTRLSQDILDGTSGGADLSKCRGFIDVNGVSLPNREVMCSAGDNKIDPGSDCVVKNNAGHMLDVFPIVFHDATVEPASGAASYVLDTSKL